MRLFNSLFSLVAAVIITGSAAPSLAATDLPSMNCRIDFTSPAARAEICTAPDGRSLVTLMWMNGPTPSDLTVLKALFAADNDKLWRRIWVASGNPVVNSDGQLALRRDVFKYGAQLLDPRAHAVVDFVANFSPAGTDLSVFDHAFTDQLIAEQNLTSMFTMICQEVGKVRTAAFALGQQDYKMDFVVGDTTNGCPGRCGPDCHQPYEWRKNQYTQECFIHDACSSLNGHWLGECSGYFLIAAIGYLLAPECSAATPPVKQSTKQL